MVFPWLIFGLIFPFMTICLWGRKWFAPSRISHKVRLTKFNENFGFKIVFFAFRSIHWMSITTLQRLLFTTKWFASDSLTLLNLTCWLHHKDLALKGFVSKVNLMNSYLSSPFVENTRAAIFVTFQSRLVQRHLSTTLRMSQLDISGIFPPIPTPFRCDEEIDYVALESNLKKWNSTGVRGYLVQGSNGEYCFLSMEERVQMVKKVS